MTGHAHRDVLVDLFERIERVLPSSAPLVLRQADPDTPPPGALRAAELAVQFAAEAKEAGMLEQLVAHLTPTSAFAVLVDPENAIEYRAGALLPIAVWHRPEDGTGWRRALLTDQHIVTYLEALGEWLATDPAILASEPVTFAEQTLVAASGTVVIPSSLLPTLIASGRSLAEGLFERIQQAKGL